MNWNQINSKILGRELYFYGRSEDWVHKALSKLNKKPNLIIDRDLAYKGKTYLGIKILPIEEINLTKDVFIIITAADYDGIIEILEEKGFKEDIHFTLSPDFANYKELTKLKDYSKKILFTCSDYNDRKRARSSKLGGGLYTLDLPSGEIIKHYVGSLRELKKLHDGYISVDYVDKKLINFNPDFQKINEADLDYPNSCGIAVDNKKSLIYIANAGKDLIEIYSLSDFKKISEKNFISEDGLSKSGGHHINDLYLHDGILYFSYFSCSGRWKKGILDGGVSCISTNELLDLDNLVIRKPLISGLTKPHSPLILDTSIYVLDSMHGYLINGSGKILSKFPGFSRGIDNDINYMYIGLSEDMYVAERSKENSTMLNSGICILNESENTYRFYPTLGIMNIHSLLAI